MLPAPEADNAPPDDQQADQGLVVEMNPPLNQLPGKVLRWANKSLEPVSTGLSRDTSRARLEVAQTECEIPWRDRRALQCHSQPDPREILWRPVCTGDRLPRWRRQT